MPLSSMRVVAPPSRGDVGQQPIDDACDDLPARDENAVHRHQPPTRPRGRTLGNVHGDAHGREPDRQPHHQTADEKDLSCTGKVFHR